MTLKNSAQVREVRDAVVARSLLFPAAFALASQVPLNMPPISYISQQEFAFKEGADVFSPRNLVELARPESGVANSAGDLVFVPVSKHSLKDKTTKKVIYVAPLNPTASATEYPALKEGDAFWLDSRTLAHVVSGKEGEPQELFAVSLRYEADSISLLPSSPVSIGKFPVSGLKNFIYSPESSTLVFSAYVWPDVNLTTVKEQDEAWDNRGDTAMAYDAPFVRHWDTWAGPKKSTLFSVGLGKNGDGHWVLQNEYVSPLKDTQHYTPIEPFGGTDNFDVSATHIVYTTKDPDVPVALHTRQNIYIVPLKGGETPRHLTSGKQGATSSPVFNKAGTMVAWTEMAEDGYEADRSKIVIYDLKKDVRFTATPEWDRSAAQLTFSPSGESLIFTAGDHGRVKIFSLEIPPTPLSSDAQVSPVPIPIALTVSHAASGVQPLENGRVLFTQSSLTSPNDVFLLSGLDTPHKHLNIEQITRFTEDDLKGKNLDGGEEFWSDGADGKTVQSWVLKPRGWKRGDKHKTWPVVLLIHGGPQDAWEDNWSVRWNLNVFAQQGYFVIAPNPTGSTGFGQEFTDRISEHWGGRPFEDLQKGWKAVLKLYPEIDTHRAVAAGASWGGYAMNWIQGHPEYGFGFKALVCHSGIFDIRYTGFSTEELYTINHEFGGPPSSKKGSAIAAQWNPSNFVEKWSTPHLLFHGSRDFRLPESESLGAFNALQQLGVDSRIVVFPDENHWVLKPENSLKWHHETFRWFAKHIDQEEQTSQ